MRALLITALVLGGCASDLDPPWQLDHDRIVAVRATPPSIGPGERAELDGLIALAGASTLEAVPDAALVASPQSLADALAFESGKWIVTAPDEARLAAARAELRLEADAPVPLVVAVAFGQGTLAATKIVRLGISGVNPTLTAMMIDGTPADTASEIVVGREVDVPLSVEALETDDVNWLTSVGTMHDFDLPEAYLHVEPDAERLEGELAVVVRTIDGGVAWRVWPIRVD